MKVPNAKIPVLFMALLFLAPAFLRAQETDPELVKLRHEWAMRYLEPGPHMELAQYFRKKGNLIQAFYILENARRYRFEQEEFDAAFLKYFGGFAPLDNSKAEEEKYVAFVKASPDNIRLLNHLAEIYVSRSDYAKAEPLFRSILEKEPQNFSAVDALAEIYERHDKPDNAKKIIDDFVVRFPESPDGYRIRIGRLFPAQPAKAKKLADEAIKRFPNEGQLWFVLGFIAENEKKLDEAEANYVKAAELEKNSPRIQARAAMFFRVHRRDNARAVKYYLNTYFLDPHAHFDGFAEAKVSGLNADIAKTQVETQECLGVKTEACLKDPNPMVVLYALPKIAAKWDANSPETFIRMLRHDDVLVRWVSMQALRAKADAGLDERLNALLQDADLRVRGLAAYIAVSHWKEKGFPAMKRLLAEESQLLRFDAVSALILYGGEEGRKIAKEHSAREPHENLRKMIDRPAETQ